MELELLPGDRLVTGCTYWNTGLGAVPYGVSFWQENCYLLTLTAPLGLKVNSGSLWSIDNVCL